MRVLASWLPSSCEEHVACIVHINRVLNNHHGQDDRGRVLSESNRCSIITKACALSCICVWQQRNTSFFMPDCALGQRFVGLILGAMLDPCASSDTQAIFTKHQSRQRTLLSADLPAVLAAAAPSMSCSETEFLACLLDPAGVGTLTLPSLLAGLADSLALMNNTGEQHSPPDQTFASQRKANTPLPSPARFLACRRPHKVIRPDMNSALTILVITNVFQPSKVLHAERKACRLLTSTHITDVIYTGFSLTNIPPAARRKQEKECNCSLLTSCRVTCLRTGSRFGGTI